jgi:hypothetical protein
VQAEAFELINFDVFEVSAEVELDVLQQIQHALSYHDLIHVEFWVVDELGIEWAIFLWPRLDVPCPTKKEWHLVFIEFYEAVQIQVDLMLAKVIANVLLEVSKWQLVLHDDVEVQNIELGIKALVRPILHLLFKRNRVQSHESRSIKGAQVPKQYTRKDDGPEWDQFLFSQYDNVASEVQNGKRNPGASSDDQLILDV